MGYYVIECQNDGNTGSAIPLWYEDESAAESKYHQILSVAAVSSVPLHGAILMEDTFHTFERQVYDRTQNNTEETEE